MQRFNQPQTLIQLISHCAVLYSDKEAIISPGRLSLTYNNLATLLKRTHQTLNALGLGPGCVVASILSNTPEAATAFLAVSASASFAPINPNYTATELEIYLTDLKPDALIVSTNAISEVGATVAQRLKISVIELVPELSEGTGSFSLCGSTALPPITADFAQSTDIALKLYTSGSTTTAKLVPILHEALCHTCLCVAEFSKLSSQDRCLNALPLFHVHGLISGLLLPLAVGGSCVYVSDFQPATFIDFLEFYDPTWYPASPTLHNAILTQIKKTPGFHKNPSLRFIRSGSAPLSVTLLSDLENTLGVPVIEPYGMTEAVHISCNPMPPAMRKQGSVGISYGMCDIRIIGPDGQSNPSMVEGEIVIHGPTVIKEYCDNAIANKESFCSQGFRTGDLGYLDQEGYLFITGRLKEVINRGGEKISPYEVDQVFISHPDVHEVACFPIPHPTLGEDIAAALVLKPFSTLEPDQLRQFIYLNLTPFKVPFHILMVEEIPKSSTGKIQRYKLAAHFAGEFNALSSSLTQDNNVKMAITALHSNLLNIWQDVLQQDDFTIHDHFLALGGDSIQASMIKVRIEAFLVTELPNQILYTCPTISALSDYLTKHYSFKVALWQINYPIHETWIL